MMYTPYNESGTSGSETIEEKIKHPKMCTYIQCLPLCCKFCLLLTYKAVNI